MANHKIYNIDDQDHCDRLLEVLTGLRLNLLRALAQEGETTILQLAGVAKRNYKNVHTDISALIKAGLVERVDPAARNSHIRVAWKRIRIDLAL